MKRISVVMLVIGMALMSVPAKAGEEGDMPEFLAMSHQVWVQPGQELEFEQGLKDHWGLHEAAGDPWTWEVWEQVTGKGTGSYSIRSAGHTWADLDQQAEVENDREHVINEIKSHAKWSQTTITEWDLEISRWPEDGGVPKMVEITEFQLKRGATKDFYHAIKQLSELIGEQELDYEYGWGWNVSGGSGPMMILAVPHANWADFKEEKPGLWEVAEEVMGRTGSGHLRSAINDAVEETRNYVVAHRPDLSYSPAKTE